MEVIQYKCAKHSTKTFLASKKALKIVEMFTITYFTPRNGNTKDAQNFTAVLSKSPFFPSETRYFAVENILPRTRIFKGNVFSNVAFLGAILNSIM